MSFFNTRLDLNSRPLFKHLYFPLRHSERGSLVGETTCKIVGVRKMHNRAIFIVEI